MGVFTKIPLDTWDGIQLDAGVILTNFDPANPACDYSNILCATSGGVNVSCVPETIDFSEDVDNVPADILEFKKIKKWTCSMTFTSLGMSLDVIKWTLGAWQPTSANGGIMPRKALKPSDAKELWWAGDIGDNRWIAIKIRNALSTGGLSLQTGKDAKGQVSVTVTGHIKQSEQELMPMEIYEGHFGCEVTFDVQSHGTAPIPQIVESGSTVEEPTAPTADGYIFGGWYKEASCTTAWVFNTDTVSTDTTLYAKWATANTVTFNANGHGTAPAAQTVATGGKATEPTAPTAEGYTFGGWYKEASCINEWTFATDTVSADTTLYAKWTQNV